MVYTAHVGYYALRYGDGPLVSGRPNAGGGPCTGLPRPAPALCRSLPFRAERRSHAPPLPPGAEGCDIGRISLELGRALREAGYRILYLPERSYDVEA